MHVSEQPILAVLDAYKAAVFAKNVDAFVGLYDQDVQVFDLWGEWLYDGVDAWRGMVSGWFGSLGDEQVVVEMQTIHTTVTQDMALAHAFISYSGVSAQGERLRTMQNRITMVLRRSGDAWKIVHEHSSAPVDFETSKVMLHQ